MVNFYDQEGNSNTAKTIDGTSINSMKNLKFEGRCIDPNSIKSETSADLIMKNGKVTVGVLREPNSELLTTYPPDNLFSQDGATGAHIHTHTDRPNGAFTWGVGLNAQTRNVKSNNGPSPDDKARTRGDMQFTKVRNAVVDRNNTYLINGDGSQTIRIPR